MSRADENLERMRDDEESDWPDRLLDDMAEAPLKPEEELSERYDRQAEALTPVQARALEYLSHGLSPRGTAEAMGLTEGRAREQVRQARYRLRVKTTIQACCEAIRRGLIH